MAIGIFRKILFGATAVPPQPRVVSKPIRELARDTVELSCKKNGAVVRSAEAADYVRNSEALSDYEKITNMCYDSSPNSYRFLLSYTETMPINALEGLDVEGLKKIEDICKVIEERCSALGIKRERKRQTVTKCLVDLYHFNPEAYEYAIKSDFLLKRFFVGDGAAYTCVRDLSVGSLKAIEDGTVTDLMRLYVDDSDKVMSKTDLIKQLKDFLSQTTTKAPLLVTRAERHTGIFADIPLNDKKLEFMIKFRNLFMFRKTKEAKFGGFPKKYCVTDFDKTSNIYEYIRSKKQLTLADAMLMMPYLTKKMQKQVLDRIKGVKIIDDRFKSTSLSEEFCTSWLSGVSGASTQSGVINKITLPTGTQGRYVRPVYDGEGYYPTNRQCEFIVNAGKKEMTISNATYDAERNCFRLESEMKFVE